MGRKVKATVFLIGEEGDNKIVHYITEHKIKVTEEATGKTSYQHSIIELAYGKDDPAAKNLKRGDKVELNLGKIKC